mgnify:FL=1
MSVAETLAEQTLCRSIGETLQKHYPGHAWMLEVAGGMVNIHNTINMKMGFRVRLSDAYNDPGLKRFIKAGGELLERAKQSRGKFDEATWRNAPKDLRGDVVMDNG